MARYLIATKYKKDGTPLKKQPADTFRRMLKVQKIIFNERFVQVTPGKLKNECWDRPRFKTCINTWERVPAKTLRQITNLEINLEMATEFTFHDEEEINFY